MKIIIYGANEIGSMISTEFFEDHDVVVIDPNEGNLESFSKLDIASMQGEGSDLQTLRDCEIESSDVFIACTNDDNKNIVSCFMAKYLSDVECVCFVSNKESLSSLRELRSGAKKEDKTFIDHIIWPEKLLTQEIFQIITVPEAVDVENFAYGKAKMLEYRIKENSVLLNKKIKDCKIQSETLIAGIVRGDELFIPNGNSELLLDDKVIFMGTPESLDITAAELFQKNNKIEYVVIIGGGSVGYQLARSLEKTSIKVKIIEKDYQRCEFLSENLSKTLVLNGDGTDLDLLSEENVSEADVTICITNKDEKNLLCSLLAKQLGSKRVLTRVGRGITAKLFERVGVDVTVSMCEAAVDEVKNRIIERKANILASVEKGLGEVIEIILKNDYKDRTLMELKMPTSAVIGIVIRNNKVIIPKGQTLIRGGDKLVIFTKAQDVDKIRNYFR